MTLEVIDSAGVIGTIRSVSVANGKLRITMDETFHEVAEGTASPALLMTLAEMQQRIEASRQKMKDMAELCGWKDFPGGSVNPFE